MLAAFLGYMQHTADIDSLPRVRLCVAVYLACLDFLIRRTLILGSCVGTESLVSVPPCSTNQGSQVCHSETIQTVVVKRGYKKFIETSIQTGPLCQRRIFHKSAIIKSRRSWEKKFSALTPIDQSAVLKHGIRNPETESRKQKRNTESDINDRKLKNFTLHNLVQSKENLS